MNGSALQGADQVLRIDKPRVRIDRYAIQAIEDTKTDLGIQLSDRETITANALTGRIEALSHRLNASGLDDITRLLLSTPEIYVWLIKRALELDRVQGATDSDGLFNSIMRNVRDRPKRYFLSNLLAHVLPVLHVNINLRNPAWRSLPSLVFDLGISIREGQTKPSVQAILDSIRDLKTIPYYLALFIEGDQERAILPRTVIARTAFTPEIRQTMTNILVQEPIEISEDKFLAGAYDQHFIFAFHEAQKRSTVKEDPIDQMRQGKQSDWDFTVEIFDTLEAARGVIPNNIKAAGALDYIYTLGELMRVFDVTNALVLRWAGGILDIPSGETASNLYRFNKLRNERATYEERAMLYKRGLNKGDGKLLSNMVANTAFPRLWEKLMVEVAEYIRKAEGKQMGNAFVSRSQIYQSTKNLQYNLTETMTGMAHIQIAEDYAHLQEAFKIIQCPEIISMFGGRRKTLWSVIEQVAKEDLGVMVPTALLKTIATEGNRIFHWIANFNEGRVQDVDFNRFLDSAEAWIIAQASIETGGAAFNGRRRAGNDEFDDEFDNAGNDDFDNW